MDSNRCSCGHRNQPPSSPPALLASLTADVGELATEDLTTLADGALVEETLELRRLADQIDGEWLRRLAAVDGRGAAGADHGIPAASTASWLRNRLRMSASAASNAVATARALFRGPLSNTAQALCAGDISAAHASVLAHGTRDQPAHTTAEAEPTLLEAARRLDPPQLRRVIGHLQRTLDPDAADTQAQRQHERRGLWTAPTIEGMVALQGLLEPEAGQTLLAALEPLARPHSADDQRSGDQRRADALTELARQALEQGQLPQSGGVRPQLSVIVDLDSLLGRPGAVGGELGGLGSLAPEACRRLACDSALTRVLVTRGDHDHPGHQASIDGRHGPNGDPCGEGDLAARLRTAMTLLPPVLGGAPRQPLDVGRSSRVITPAQRAALAVRDGGCVFPDCGRPPAWCDGHHLIHWLDGGPTDLDNLALLCRTHHRTVHEGGWQLTRGPDGHFTATPPQRPRRHPPPHRRQRVDA
jgi:Domain of unknown function (DUF222)/HNH endonuclease